MTVSLQHEESKMSALKSLTFTILPKIGANPTLDRRTNIIARLEEQKLLLNDPNYTRTVRTWVKKDGQLTPVDKQQRVLPWWRVNADWQPHKASVSWFHLAGFRRPAD